MDDCIEAEVKSRDKDGYGKLRRGRRWIRAHRYAWEQANGPIPDGMLVLHRCDNPPCVNVDHLYLGTPADNMRDKVERGRWRGGRPKNPSTPEGGDHDANPGP